MAWSLFPRALGAVFLISFLSASTQLLGLVGSRGLEPAAFLFAAIKRDLDPLRRALYFPSLFLISTADWFLMAVCLAGVAASAAIVVGGGTFSPYLFLTVWICWLSIQVSNPTLFSFPWDLLVTECAFFGALLPAGGGTPLPAVQFYFNWLLFRVMFGMGLTRFRERGPTERNLTYIFHFLQWQPKPTPVAAALRRLPMWCHRLAYGFLFWTEVLMPLAMFGPPWLRTVAGASFVLLQLGIWATGNYGTFNVLTIVLCLPLLAPLPPVGELLRFGPSGFETSVTIGILLHTVAGLPSVFIFNFWSGSLWLFQRDALRETSLAWILRPLAAALRVIAPFRVLNSYGVFRYQSVYVEDRLVVRLQGTADGFAWRDYEPRFLTSQEGTRPPFFAPHHPRLDHFLFYGLCEDTSFKVFMLMACNPYYFDPFCLTEKLVQKLLRADAVALSFFRANPFPDGRPIAVRYALYRYRFTAPAERRATGRWWESECLGASEAIGLTDVDASTGIRPTYDRFIAATQSRGTFTVREFVDPRTGTAVPMHLHTIRRHVTVA